MFTAMKLEATRPQEHGDKVAEGREPRKTSTTKENSYREGGPRRNRGELVSERQVGLDNTAVLKSSLNLSGTKPGETWWQQARKEQQTRAVFLDN